MGHHVFVFLGQGNTGAGGGGGARKPVSRNDFGDPPAIV